MVTRFLEKIVQDQLFKKKVVLLMGARQTGKTTLLKKIANTSPNTLWINGDEYDIQERFRNATSTQLKSLIGNHRMVIIDEAQRIDNIGLSLKIIHDTYPDIQLIASGSSSFELKNKTSEPLTGRKFEYVLFPISYAEMVAHHSELIENRYLSTRLVYGSYPEIISNEGEEMELLKFLSDSYLFKDILMLDTVKKPEKLVKLLQALALQVGSEVSYNEIGNLIGLDSKTIETYINLLEKSFIIFKLNSYNRNVRTELKLAKKIYFYDNGIRNALISNFQRIEARQDVGVLFENFMISDRMKRNHYCKYYANSYFWRTREQQEIDYIEEYNGQLSAFEFKWNLVKKRNFPRTFTDTYLPSTTEVITPQNFGNFLSSNETY
jgi:uncharacterized protein